MKESIRRLKRELQDNMFKDAERKHRDKEIELSVSIFWYIKSYFAFQIILFIYLSVLSTYFSDKNSITVTYYRLQRLPVMT